MLFLIESRLRTLIHALRSGSSAHEHLAFLSSGCDQMCCKNGSRMLTILVFVTMSAWSSLGACSSPLLLFLRPHMVELGRIQRSMSLVSCWFYIGPLSWQTRQATFWDGPMANGSIKTFRKSQALIEGTAAPQFAGAGEGIDNQDFSADVQTLEVLDPDFKPASFPGDQTNSRSMFHCSAILESNAMGKLWFLCLVWPAVFFSLPDWAALL